MPVSPHVKESLKDLEKSITPAIELITAGIPAEPETDREVDRYLKNTEAVMELTLWRVKYVRTLCRHGPLKDEFKGVVS